MKKVFLLAVLFLSMTMTAQKSDKVRMNVSAESNISFTEYQLNFEADLSKLVTFESVLNHTTKGDLMRESRAITYDNFLVVGKSDKFKVSGGVRYHRDFTYKNRVIYVMYRVSIKIF